jgi:hypothetical protein
MQTDVPKLVTPVGADNNAAALFAVVSLQVEDDVDVQS